MTFSNVLGHIGFFIVICFFSFVMITNLSGDTDMIIYGLENMSPRSETEFSFLNFYYWIISLSQGHLGMSKYHHIEVTTLLFPALKISAQLIGFALLLTIILTIFIFTGFIIAVNPFRSLIKRGLDILIIIPNYIITLMFIILFSLVFPFFSLVQEGVSGFFLPALAIATCQSVILSKLMIQNFLLEQKKNYTQTSKAKGNADQVTISKHILINTLYPISNHFIILINTLLSSTLIIEIIFNIRGLNYLLYRATETRDTPVLMACLIIFYMIITMMQIFNDLLLQKIKG